MIRRMKDIVLYVVLTYAISWSLWLIGWHLAGRSTSLDAFMPWIMAGSFGPGIAAAILLLGQGKGIRTWLKCFVRLRINLRVYALSLLPLPLIFLAMTVVLGFRPNPAELDGGSPLMAYVTLFPAAILNGLMSIIFGAGPLGEEGGWRGYLLPRLLERYSMVHSSLLLGIIWALWHLPIIWLFPDFRDGIPMEIYLPAYVLMVVLLSYIYSLIWQWSGRSLFLCIWFHGLFNATADYAFKPFWLADWSAQMRLAFLLVAVAILAGLFRLAARKIGHRFMPTIPGHSGEA